MTKLDKTALAYAKSLVNSWKFYLSEEAQEELSVAGAFRVERRMKEAHARLIVEAKKAAKKGAK